MNPQEFKQEILKGIPDEIPADPVYDPDINHAPRRKDILTSDEKKLALRNALRYFKKEHHSILAPEFLDELNQYGRIYMYRYRPHYRITSGKIDDYPYRSKHAAAIMVMVNNNLDEDVAQHPHELITYGGNGAVFQNWAQYLLTMKYLATMTDEQTLVLYSGHPLGLFPGHKEAPRVVITNGMVIPNYSSADEYEKFNALGVTQYGQMTAGSFMYIGPQGIVHGTAITVINAGRKIRKNTNEGLAGKVFVTSGLGGMSGAQPKATVIAGGICLVAEINPKAILKRKSQGWIDEVYEDLDKVISRVNSARKNREAVSVGYAGNIVDLWEKLVQDGMSVDLGSDQTSLHNPFAGGYYPAGLDFNESNRLMADDPEKFRTAVQESLKRQVAAINVMAGRGMYFWDYGNAFLLESGRAGADIFRPDGRYRYPSYVEDIMGPLYFDYGFGPFRWVCTSNDPGDLELTDRIAIEVLEKLHSRAPEKIKVQLADNIQWIKQARKNRLVVGSQARILYADCEGRIEIAHEFNKAIHEGRISAPVVLGRDHHDVSGTDSPFRETSNIYDGSKFTADMAIHNVIGDAFRGATWVSIHNGGGVGWGEVINGGFGMVLDGTVEAGRRLEMMLYWDVNNGIARRSWARNEGAMLTAAREMEKNPALQVTIPNIPDEEIINGLF
jgi:urocanate hydratase